MATQQTSKRALPTRSTATLLASGIVFAILGQYQYTVHQHPLDALLWYSIGALQWIAALSTHEIRAWLKPPSMVGVPGTVEPVAHPRRRSLLALGGTGLAVIVFIQSRDTFFDPLLVAAWVGSVALWWQALAPPNRHPDKPAPPKIAEIAALITIMIIGTAGLHYKLDAVPGVMISDHVGAVFDTVNVMEGKHYIYFGGASGREPAFFFLTALVASITGPSFLSLKIVTTTAALLTLPFLYLLGREIEGPIAGLSAAALGAVSVWQLIMGRLGFRAPLAALASAAFLYIFCRALRTNRRRDYMLAGLALGLGHYGYTAFRVAPLLVLVGVAIRWLDSQGAARRHLLFNLFALLAIAALTFLPLLTFWLHYPEVYWTRARSLTGDVGGEAITQIIDGLTRSLLMFNFAGDPVKLNVIPRGYSKSPRMEPVASGLGPVTGALFLLGMLAWLWRASIWRRTAGFLLPAALVIFILPSALGIHGQAEMPSLRRAVTALPPVMVLSGSGLALAVRAIKATDRQTISVKAIAFGVGVIALSAAINLPDYFEDYATAYNIGAPPQREAAAEIERFLAAGGELENVFIVYGPAWLDPRIVSIWLEKPHWDNVIANVTDCPAGSGPMLFLLGDRDEQNRHRLVTCFDRAEVVEHTPPERTSFFTVRIP